MNTERLNLLFRRILSASLTGGVCLGAVGCSAMVTPVDGDVPADVSRTDGSDVPPVDVISVDVPPDNPVCTPRISSPVSCDATVTWPCNPPPGVVPGQPIDMTVCASACPTGMFGGSRAFLCSASRNSAGETVLNCTYCAVGRRTAGLADVDGTDCDDPVGRFLASNATLEAASVTAFERLGDELSRFGLPETLRAWIEQSADEERDHAARVREAALAWGARPAEPHIETVALRSLVDVAIENATEGCVRETFGALVAHWQSARASDASLRALFARLADDETRHAALSWELHRWLSAQLNTDARDAVRRAQRDAIAALRREVAAGVDRSLVCVAGVPDTEHASAMLDSLDAQLWA